MYSTDLTRGRFSALALASLMLLCFVVPADSALALSRPVIISQGFTISGGELDLRLYGDDFKIVNDSPILFFDADPLENTSYTNKVIRASVDLPIELGTHTVSVSSRSRMSNERTLEFSLDMRDKIDADRIILGLDPVLWSGAVDTGSGSLLMDSDLVDASVDTSDVSVDVSGDDPSEGFSLVNATDDLSVVSGTLTSEMTFTDLDRVPWVINYLPRLFDRGAIRGFADNTFRPEAYVTRAEALKMMMEALEVSLHFDFDVSRFEDVSLDDWVHPYSELALGLGVLVDSSDKQLYPNQPITRLDVSRALLDLDRLYFDREYIGESDFVFTDLSLSDNSYISPLVLMEVIDRHTFFRANDFLTRAEWTKILDLFLERRDIDLFRK